MKELPKQLWLHLSVSILVAASAHLAHKTISPLAHKTISPRPLLAPLHLPKAAAINWTNYGEVIVFSNRTNIMIENCHFFGVESSVILYTTNHSTVISNCRFEPAWSANLAGWP